MLIGLACVLMLIGLACVLMLIGLACVLMLIGLACVLMLIGLIWPCHVIHVLSEVALNISGPWPWVVAPRT
jgi:fatty acid desaturase